MAASFVAARACNQSRTREAGNCNHSGRPTAKSRSQANSSRVKSAQFAVVRLSWAKASAAFRKTFSPGTHPAACCSWWKTSRASSRTRSSVMFASKPRGRGRPVT
jgi:hypothetical protein